jgi:hypothetical protein
MYEEGLKELSSLTDERFAAIEKGLSQVEMASSTAELASKIAILPEVDEDQLGKIFRSVRGLTDFLAEGATLDQIIDDVVSICLRKKLTQETEIPKLRSRLFVLLSNNLIYYAYKAQDLVTENENVFLSCRIISDIRPIFEVNLEESPKVGLIMHNLHIHYQSDESGPHQDIYFSLNSSDVQSLIAALERAETKEETLENIMTKSSMININK